MASLTGQSIASSYEQLLALPDGGLNGTTLVAITDGDSSTEVGFKISTNALSMNSTNQLQFGDTGTYIHQSADGVLDLVSDTEIEINATTIDMNGALDLSGDATIGGKIEINGYGLTLVRSAPVIEFNDTDESGTDDGGGKFKIASDNDRLSFFGRADNDSTWDERVVLKRNGHVGIGTASPSDYLADADNLVVASSGNTGITIASTGTDQICKLVFADGTDGTAEYIGQVAYNHNGDTMTLGTGGADRFVLDANSRISLGNNDSSGATSNTIFGRLAGDDIASASGGAIQNTIIGDNAGHELKLGDSNVAIGFKAMFESYISDAQEANTKENTYIGTLAGSGTWVTAGSFGNTGIGAYSSDAAQNGAQYNTAVGFGSLGELVSGKFNVAVGAESGKGLTSGTNNVAIGSWDNSSGTIKGALGTNEVGSYNIAIGTGALATANEDDNNGTVAIGHLACAVQAGTGGAEFANATTAVGHKALTDLTTGTGNVAVGYEAGTNATTASLNTFVGYLAGHGNDSTPFVGSWNTCIGEEAGYLLEGGANANTLVGQGAGDTITVGDENTCIGRVADVSGSTAQNQTVIGYGTTGKGDDTVTLGNADVTAVYMASDSGATVHSAKIKLEHGGSATAPSIYFGTDTNTGIYHSADNNLRITINGTKAVEIDASRNMDIDGALSKGSGSFKIDHPLEAKKDTHHLVHSFVESPQADNIYRGKTNLSNGSVEINLDTVSGMSEGTFVLLNTDIQCFTSNESDWDAVKGSVSGNILTISCQNTDSTATVSWLVIGERQDDHIKETNWTDENGKVIVEPEKK